MSPRNAVSILVVLAAASTAWKGFRDADARRNDPLRTPAPASARTARANDPGLLWTRTTTGGASFDCPFALKPLDSTEAQFAHDASANIQRFAGGDANHRIIFWHASYPFVQGQVAPERFLQLVYVIAPEYNFAARLLTGPATTINGMTAKRLDSSLGEYSHRTHGRLVVFTQDNQAWFLFFEAPEDAGEMEEAFRKMAMSLHPV